jgi:calcium-dependent protein kinase
MGCGLSKSNDTISNSRLLEDYQTNFFTKVNLSPEIRVNFGISKENIHNIYLFGATIGQGYFSKVKEAKKKSTLKDETSRYAIKIIKKKQIEKRLRDDFLNELSILSILDHPNVIKLHETYEDENSYYLVMEHLSGGDVFHRIDKMERLDERFIARVLYKIISAINYCHSIGVVHRDIKPDNILFSDESEQAEVKIIDYGLGKKFSSQYSDLMHSFIGTPYFVAPEVINQEYNSNCDMWSIGATAYMLFTGTPPFNGICRTQVLNGISKKEADFTPSRWGHVSEEALDFVKKLLIKDPRKRMTSQTSLKHNFFNKINLEVHDIQQIDTETLKNLRQFQIPHKFKKLILGSLIDTLEKEELKKLNETFHAIDLNHEGFISLYELKKAFELSGLELNENEINEIIERIDYDKNGKLNYSEFLIAAINIQKTIDNQKLKKLFKRFDIDNSGYISVESLMKAMLRGGREVVNVNEAAQIIKEVCQDKNARISYEDFFRIMTHN